MKIIGLYTEKYGYLDNIQEMSAQEFKQKNLRYMFTYFETITSDGIYVYEDRTDGKLYYITGTEMKKEGL